MEQKSFKDKFNNEIEAKELLEKSRNQIDKIDNKLIDLIYERTELALDIVSAKKYLNMDIFDKERELAIEEKIAKIAKNKDIDLEILSDIMNNLRILSKNKQKEINNEIN